MRRDDVPDAADAVLDRTLVAEFFSTFVAVKARAGGAGRGGGAGSGIEGMHMVRSSAGYRG